MKLKYMYHIICFAIFAGMNYLAHYLENDTTKLW